MKFHCKKMQAGPLRFGMNRSEVRAVLGDCDEFLKSNLSENTSDDFMLMDAHVYYDASNVIKGIEFFRDSNVDLLGVNPFGMGVSSFLGIMKSKGISNFKIDSGVKLSDIGVRLYVPDMAEDEDARIESVYIEFQ